MYGIEKETIIKACRTKETTYCKEPAGCEKRINKGTMVLEHVMGEGCNGTIIVTNEYCTKCAPTLLGILMNDVRGDHGLYDIDDVEYMEKKIRSVAKKLGISKKALDEAIDEAAPEE